jgi:SAM-dependent methyltransferase
VGRRRLFAAERTKAGAKLTDRVLDIGTGTGANLVREISRMLAEGGKALIAVPAFPSLWGLQDRKAFHKRRYRMNPLLALLRAARLSPERFYHFNFPLFVPIYIARRMIDLLRVDLKSEGELNSRLLNRILLAVFALDISTASMIKPPFGVSILVLACKQ